VGFCVDVLDGAAVFLLRHDAAPALGALGDEAGWVWTSRQRTYIEELEGRIAQLEEKLDFTERLVTGRRDG
jgi:hypothetical protein